MTDCNRTVFSKSIEEVDEAIKSYEYETWTKSIIYNKDKSFGLAAKGNLLHTASHS